ncbi:MAG: LUD domain-containing protein [Fuerstiella sp.]
MMSTEARDQIFSRLKSALVESAPLPNLPVEGPWLTFADPLAKFTEVLESVGGACHHVANVSEANDILQKFDEWKDAAVRFSVVPGVGESNVDLDAIDDPHDLENTDFAVLHGHFAVAENAAIWVTDDTVKHRALYFLPQRMALVIPRSAILHNMHEAYGRISFGQNPFSCFISGPSKTADIEQSLVIGAHGARALTVFAVDDLS